MNDSNGAPEFVRSQSNQSPVAAKDSRSRLQPTVRSIGWNDSLTESDAPLTTSDPEPSARASVDDASPPAGRRPIFKLNALGVQALLYPIIVVIYLVIGAAIFTAIEQEQEEMAKEVAADKIKMAIINVSEKYNLSENIAEEILNDYTYLCTDTYLQIRNGSNEWAFLPSFYFTATAVTAVGEA